MTPPIALPPLLQCAPVAIAALDLQGVVLDVNRALLDASGYSIDGIRGLPFSEFLDPGDELDARASFGALVSGTVDSYRAARRYRTSSGDLRDVDLSVSLVRDDAGAPLMCMAVLQDVTEHTRALDDVARHAAQLEAVIESMRAGVHIGGEEGITRANRAAVEQLGFRGPQELEQPIAALAETLRTRDAATGERIGGAQQPFARALRGETVDTEIVARHLRTGADVFLRVIAAPVRVKGRIIGAVSVNINMTERRQIEESQRLSEARYRALVEQAPLSIQILAPDGRTLHVNEAWERLWGLTLDQLGGYNLLQDQQLVERGLMPFILAAFDGEPARVPAALYDPRETLPDTVMRKDAGRWVRAVIYPLKDDRGRVREVVLVHEDITEQVRADEQRREATDLLQLLVQQSGEAIVVADAQGIVRIFNPAAERLYGVPGSAVRPEDWGQYFRLRRLDGTPLPFEETALYRALNGQTVRDFRWLVPREDGSTRMLVGSSAPLRTPDGERAGAVLIARDETDRVAAEAERERLLIETQRAHEEVQTASRLKDEFLATLSHELRTPLNAVLGWTKILRTRDTQAPADHALEVIERNALAQARLIDDLLDVSRIITGKIVLQIEPVDMKKVAAAALETLMPAAEARGLRIAAHLPEALPTVPGDVQRLQQIFWNLLSNAVKFTEPGGQVTLSIEAEPRALVITVSDSGIGIGPEILPYVFDRFTQGDASSTRTHAGLGLGLAIVRHLVELHGGNVSAASAGRGHGATFKVMLPILNP